MNFEDDIEKIKSDLKTTIVKLANLQDVVPEKIDDKGHLFGDGLGLDSIDLLEIVVYLEKQYGLKVANDDEGKKTLTSIESLANKIMEHQKTNLKSGTQEHGKSLGSEHNSPA